MNRRTTRQLCIFYTEPGRQFRVLAKRLRPVDIFTLSQLILRRRREGRRRRLAVPEDINSSHDRRGQAITFAEGGFMRFAVDSIIIGLLALRVLPGQKLRRITESMLIALFSWSMLAGCATQNAKTVETQKTVEYAADSDRAAPAPVVTEKQTTKTEETSKSDGASVGVLGGTVHVVGEVLALPFRAVAGLINLVF